MNPNIVEKILEVHAADMKPGEKKLQALRRLILEGKVTFSEIKACRGVGSQQVRWIREILDIPDGAIASSESRWF